MYISHSTGCILILASVVAFAKLSASDGEERRGSGTPRAYESPDAVFEAYRRGPDPRKLFQLLTPNAQDELVGITSFAFSELGPEKANAILSEYVDGSAAEKDYQMWYKKKAWGGSKHEGDRPPAP